MKLHVQTALRIALLFVAIGASAVADESREKAIEQDRMKYFGEWQIVSVEVDGNRLNKDDFK